MRRIDAWRVQLDLHRPTREQMAYDEVLAAEALPTVRCFVWEPPAISFGWKQAPPEWLTTRAWQAAGWASVERPTGGGIAFHGSDVSISIIVPRGAVASLDSLMRTVCHQAARLCETYAAPAEALIDVTARGQVTHCLTELSPYAVLLQGRKVAGFALRRYPNSWLIQGSLLARPLPEQLVRGLPAMLQQALQTRAISLSEAAGTPLRAQDIASRWAQQWTQEWETSPHVQEHLTHAL
jgi:lipoate-protein ligase A